MTTGKSISPWFSVKDAEKAVIFYKSAFGATETYRLETPDGTVVRLSVNGPEFWVSGGHNSSNEAEIRHLGGDSVRMVLTVPDPEVCYDRAIKAGARQIFPVGEDHGWKLGRLEDPFGLHWEIGHPLP